MNRAVPIVLAVVFMVPIVVAAERATEGQGGTAVVAPAKRVHMARQRARVLRERRARYAPHVAEAARRHGVRAELIHAVIEVESAYQPAAVSSAGAVGLMQLMPETARRYGVEDSTDPRQNIEGGVAYLRDLHEQFRGDLRLVLAAYNAGEEAVERFGRRVPPYAETQAYVIRVTRLLRSRSTMIVSDLAGGPLSRGGRAGSW